MAMYENWLTIKKIAEQTEIPEPTIRRYLETFHKFIKCRQLGRSMRYDPETINLVRHLNKSYGNGMTTAEIMENISTIFPQDAIVNEAVPVPDQKRESMPVDFKNNAVMNILNQQSELLGKITSCMEVLITQQQKSMDNNNKEVTEIKNQMEQITELYEKQVDSLIQENKKDREFFQKETARHIDAMQKDFEEWRVEQSRKDKKKKFNWKFWE